MATALLLKLIASLSHEAVVCFTRDRLLISPAAGLSRVRPMMWVGRDQSLQKNLLPIGISNLRASS